MNRLFHITTGILFSLPFMYIQHLAGILPEVFYCLLAAFLGSRLPDILDKPTDYRHRKAFHSKELLDILPFVMVMSITAAFMYPEIEILSYIFYFSAGYYLHLAMDSRTKMGLPKIT